MMKKKKRFSTIHYIWNLLIRVISKIFSNAQKTFHLPGNYFLIFIVLHCFVCVANSAMRTLCAVSGSVWTSCHASFYWSSWLEGTWRASWGRTGHELYVSVTHVCVCTRAFASHWHCLISRIRALLCQWGSCCRWPGTSLLAVATWRRTTSYTGSHPQLVEMMKMIILCYLEDS